MTVTINAHQLGRLIDQTASHIGPDTIKALHGIRLDVDSTHLYAVASDRYTLAASRYRLNADDQNGQPWASTIPGERLPGLREWVRSFKGAQPITIEAGEGRLVFDAPQSTYSVAADPGIEFPNWRGLFRAIVEQATEDTPFPALQSAYLGRWANTGHILRVRVSADMKAVLLFGEDFIGAMMPAKYAGVGPVTDETFDSARSLWSDVLASGETADMTTDMPAEDPDVRRHGATKDVRETGEALLQEVLRSTYDVYRDVDYDTDRDLWFAQIRIGVANWTAYRYLDALYQVDPRKAAEVVADVAEQLDSGEIGEWAWGTAEESGYSPQKWHDDHEKAVAKKNAKSAPAWAERFAAGLNAARLAGITFSVEANEHVAYDHKTEQWVAAKPEPVTADASA